VISSVLTRVSGCQHRPKHVLGSDALDLPHGRATRGRGWYKRHVASLIVGRSAGFVAQVVDVSPNNRRVPLNDQQLVTDPSLLRAFT
jgi:hypothetical protein